MSMRNWKVKHIASRVTVQMSGQVARNRGVNSVNSGIAFGHGQ